MRFKAILFDLDGTLIDSVPFHEASFVGILRTFDIELPREELFYLISLPSQELFRRLNQRKRIPLSLKDFLRRRRHRLYKMVKGKELLFSDTLEVLGGLGKRFKLAVVTGSGRRTVQRTTTPAFRKLFQAFITYDDVEKPKPSPKPFLLAAERLGVKPSSCLVVGDSLVDLQAARAAKMKAVALTSGVGFREQLEEEKPLAVFDSRKEFLSWIKRQP